METCIWECVHQDNCQTAVYYHDNHTCLLFGENCQIGNITSSGNIRASVICYRKNQNTYCQALVTTMTVAITMSPEPNWTTTGIMNVARAYHTASMLANGTILVAGGWSGGLVFGSYNKIAELFDPSTGTWTSTGNMKVARGYHTASMLSNGTILVTGGWNGIYSLDITELYDPSTGIWTATGNMNVARAYHTASLLSNGTILVTGGWNGISSLDSAELYNPSTGIWTSTGNMNVERGYHTASLLANGTILVTGGWTGGLLGGSYTNTAELFDPSTGIWAATGNMNVERGYHIASMLSNGKILVTGGWNSGGALKSAELYDPLAGTWTATENMNVERKYHTASMLANGTILVTGGWDGSTSLNTAELY
ncbi:unnamed protein product [Adineta ricciae]|uniref:Apple domain-containing protein n=1 Tax=Adineta ricciae TaxID=249248 RepID=A0A815M0C4_ADIRI|nr:unnamed protein product [Adineta ricciae]CAF1416396.1 unnamed protein product [Adineta ricciae]